MTPDDAEKLGVVDKQFIAINFPGKRAGTLDEIMVRIDPHYSLELHLDIEEGNALGLNNGDIGHLITDLDKSSYSPFR